MLWHPALRTYCASYLDAPPSLPLSGRHLYVFFPWGCLGLWPWSWFAIVGLCFFCVSATQHSCSFWACHSALDTYTKRNSFKRFGDCIGFSLVQQMNFDSGSNNTRTVWLIYITDNDGRENTFSVILLFPSLTNFGYPPCDGQKSQDIAWSTQFEVFFNFAKESLR